MISPPQRVVAGQMYLVKPAPLGIITLLIYAIVIYGALITADARSGEENIFYEIRTLRVANLFVLDILSFLLAGLVFASGLGRRLWSSHILIAFSVCTASVLTSGLVGTHLSGYTKIAKYGPELRGLVDWQLIVWAVSSYVYTVPNRVTKIIWLFTVMHLVRCLIEIFFIRSSTELLGVSWVVDSSTLAISATLAVFWLCIFMHSDRGKARSFILFAVLSVIVGVGYRRTAIIIEVLGVISLASYIIWNRRRTKRFLAVVFMTVVAFIMFVSFGRFSSVGESLYYRFAGILQPGLRTGSDIEHLADMDDAFIVIKANPILGAGMATDIPGRALSRYSDVMPFHSSYYHTWVRLGLAGILCYLLFAAYLIRCAAARKAFPVHSERYVPFLTGRASAFSVGSLILFLVKFPPFYLDPKLVVFAGVFSGIVIAMRQHVLDVNAQPGVLRKQKVTRMRT